MRNMELKLGFKLDMKSLKNDENAVRNILSGNYAPAAKHVKVRDASDHSRLEASPLYGSEDRWDHIAGKPSGVDVKSVSVDGRDVTNVCVAVSVSRGEALCIPHKIVNGKIHFIDEFTAGDVESPELYVDAGSVVVQFHSA